MLRALSNELPRFEAEEKTVVPFLKWAGGKRWLLKTYPELFPEKFDTYLEPFLGSGAIFFGLKPARAFLSDRNSVLVECYDALRADHRRVERHLAVHAANHCARYYYDVRGRSYRTPSTRAAAFLYLNRVCWNGLYRVNLRGQFNVPLGTKTAVLLDTDNFSETAKRLSVAKIAATDFEKTIDVAGSSDFIFADPPYTVKHNNNGFIKYNEALFEWADQVRLKEALERASKRGALFMLTNADHSSIRRLYQGMRIRKVRRFSVLSGDASFRGETSEVVITNY
ncbi:DNA adenine methylase [Bradyrhizobium sp. USDA 4529]